MSSLSKIVLYRDQFGKWNVRKKSHQIVVNEMLVEDQKFLIMRYIYKYFKILNCDFLKITGEIMVLIEEGDL